jgi:hypothetical protein
MAKYNSIFEVRGHIGASTFQKRDGKMVVGRTSSLDKSKIEQADAFQRTRENMSEFGGSAVVGKSLREGIAAAVERFADGRFAGRLTACFRRISKFGAGARGQRMFEVFSNRAHLEGLEFDKSMPLTQVFFPDYTVSVNAARNEVTLDLPIFPIDTFVRVPQGATHWQLVLAITVVTDHSFDTVTTRYVPVDATLNGLNATVESGLLPVTGLLPNPLQLVATLPGNPTLSAAAGLMACVGVEFSQNVNGVPYVFAQHNAMRLVNVF